MRPRERRRPAAVWRARRAPSTGPRETAWPRACRLPAGAFQSDTVALSGTASREQRKDAGAREDVMTGRRRPRDAARLLHSVFGPAAIMAAVLTALAAPAMAQAPAGIPGVLAPGAVPELVQ